MHPSFQMSFAATLALVAGYERGMPWARAGATVRSAPARRLWGVNEIVGLTLASLLAGLATTPYAAYHFHRIAPYGVLANLLAMPVVSAWVMPMGILGVIAMPFGFDAECWRQMGYGIEWMDKVALWVASLPGAFGRVTSFGTGPLLLATAGSADDRPSQDAAALERAGLAALAISLRHAHPQPDVLVANDGRIFAVRGADGRLAFHHTGGDTFAMRNGSQPMPTAVTFSDRALGQGIACDPSGCVGRLADGRLVSYALNSGRVRG